jgi:hypothetical protein
MHTGLIQQVSPLHKLPTKTSTRGRALTPQQALDLRDEFLAGVSTAALATKYGVSKMTAYRIATGKAYAELSAVTNPRARMPWIDPPVRRRGGCDDSEIAALAPMLRAYPRRRALVKQTKRMPHLSPCTIPGVNVSVVREPDGFAVYLQWAEGQQAIA